MPNTGGLGLERVGIELGPRRLPHGGPGVAHVGARHLRRRRLHRAAAAGLGRGHAGPHRDVSRAGRGGASDPACARWPSTVFTRPGDRRRRCAADGDRRRRVPARGPSCCRCTPTPRAKMSRAAAGFVKIFCRPATGVVIGGVVVAPIASRADPADRGGRAATGSRSTSWRRRLLGLPVAVRFDHRGRAPPDGARRSGLTADSKTEGNLT